MSLATDVDDLLDTVIASDGVSVTYARTGKTSQTITAVRGRSQFRTTDPDGRLVLIKSDRDYLILPADINFGDGNGAVEPQRGDRITDGSDTYEVWPVVAGESHFRRSDLSDAMYRVHCKKV